MARVKHVIAAVAVGVAAALALLTAAWPAQSSSAPACLPHHDRVVSAGLTVRLCGPATIPTQGGKVNYSLILRNRRHRRVLRTVLVLVGNSARIFQSATPQPAGVRVAPPKGLILPHGPVVFWRFPRVAAGKTKVVKGTFDFGPGTTGNGLAFGVYAETPPCHRSGSLVPCSSYFYGAWAPPYR